MKEVERSLLEGFKLLYIIKSKDIGEWQGFDISKVILGLELDILIW